MAAKYVVYLNTDEFGVADDSFGVFIFGIFDSIEQMIDEVEQAMEADEELFIDPNTGDFNPYWAVEGYEGSRQVQPERALADFMQGRRDIPKYSVG